MYATLSNHGHSLKVAPSVILASPHPSVENGNVFEGDSDSHTGGQSKGLSRISFFTFLK